MLGLFCNRKNYKKLHFKKMDPEVYKFDETAANGFTFPEKNILKRGRDWWENWDEKGRNGIDDDVKKERLLCMTCLNYDIGISFLPHFFFIIPLSKDGSWSSEEGEEEGTRHRESKKKKGDFFLKIQKVDIPWVISEQAFGAQCTSFSSFFLFYFWLIP